MIWKGAFQPACLVAAVLFISGPTGCESPQPRPPVPTTPPITAAATIQIRVAVHLKDHIIWHEQIGDRDNIGCRLTEDEILAYLEELQSFATQKLGIGVQLQWNWPPDEFPDLYLVNRGLYTGMTIEFFRERLLADPGFDPGRINIYFTGWILPLSGPGNSQLGACLDPFCADALGLLPHIFINDLDFAPDQPPGVNPFYTEGYWIQCHEFCHYLLRRDFDDPWDPDAEHWPSGSDWLMRAAGVMPYPHRLHPTLDTDRIRRRIELDMWNNPNLTDMDP